ncbi:MAG: hypothetical protein V3U24_00055 [Candidatus Neomarinimicrobiota bacterium]
MIEFLKKLGLPEAYSLQAEGVDIVIGWVHVLMFALFVGWGTFFIFTLFRFRRSRNPEANYAGVKGHLSTYVEVGVVLFEALLLIALSFPVWASRVEGIPDESEAEVVRVVAQQFRWNIRYPGPDNVFGRTAPDLIDDQALNFIGLDWSDDAANDDIIPTQGHLHLPVNKPCLIYLSTRDVIHSLSIPVMRVKQDAIPGMRTPVWFTPTQTGSWEVACAQLCGNSHYEMKGFVHVHTPGGYEAYMAALGLVKEIDDYDLSFEAEATLAKAIEALKAGNAGEAESLAIEGKSQAGFALKEKEELGEEEGEEWEEW